MACDCLASLSQSRVSCTTRSPRSSTRICRAISNEMASSTNLKELMFFNSALVPSFCSNVGLADDLDQRHAGAVVIDARAGFAVQVLAGVLFHVDARQAHASLFAAEQKFHRAALRDWLVVLRDLKSLGQIGIEVEFAREARAAADVASG